MRVLLLVAALALFCVASVTAVAVDVSSLGQPQTGYFACYGSWAGSRRIPMSNNGNGDSACWDVEARCESACKVKPNQYEPGVGQSENDIFRRYDALPCIKACTDEWIECDKRCAAKKQDAVAAKAAADQAAWVAAENARKAAAAAEAQRKADAATAAAAQKAKDDAAAAERAQQAAAKKAQEEAAAAAAKKAADAAAAAAAAANKPTQPSKPWYGGNGGSLQPTPVVRPNPVVRPIEKLVKPTKPSSSITTTTTVNTNINSNSNNVNRVNINNSGNTVTNNNSGQFAGNQGTVNVGQINQNSGGVNIGEINVNGLITNEKGEVTVNVRLLDSSDLDEKDPKTKVTRTRVCTNKNIQRFPELEMPCLCTASKKKTFPSIRDDCAAYDKQVADRKAAEKKAKAAAKKL